MYAPGPMSFRLLPRFALVAGLALVGCKKDDPATGPAAPGIAPGANPMARLNTAQYVRSVEDLFGLSPSPRLGFPEDPVVDGYDNNVGNNSLSQVRADALFDAAEGVAATLASDPGAILPCDPAQVDDACIDAFIASTGRRVYRRSLTADEQAILRGLYDSEPSDPVADKLELTLTAMLFAPQFLYRPEFVAGGELTPLSGTEIATRMAYALWASTPDDALLDAAESGVLDTPEGIEVEARRMLADAKGQRGVRTFLTQWADVRDLAMEPKDTDTYPRYGPDLVAAMERELDTFIDRTVWENSGNVADLLLSRDTEVNLELAILYNVDHPGDDSWVDVKLPKDKRSGVLTLGAFLATKAHSIAPAPTQRGKYVRNRLLCQDIPPPPDDVDVNPPEPDNVTTNRERNEQHSNDPACSGCHDYMDPIGYGFENFDSIGMWRDLDGGQPVDATGELFHTEDIDGPFDGANDLMAVLANSAQVRQCMAEQVFRYTYGRRSRFDDAGMLQIDAFASSTDGAIVEMLVGATTSDGFRYRAGEP